ncbi:MAG: hypothetical protein R3F14_35420 [Polyangiaceae bacterium]
MDGNLLRGTDNDRRLLARPVRDGFIPGEGAAFLVLARPGTVNLRDPVPLLYRRGGERAGARASLR